MKHIDYTLDDLEKFIALTKEIEQKPDSKSLRKLLSVRDKISIFKNIDPVHLKALVYDVKFVTYEHKEYVLKQGEESKEVFFIIDGECQIFYNKHYITSLHAGEVFGESGVLFHKKRNASVVCASKKATLLSFCIDDEESLFTAQSLAKLYRNLAFQINDKLEELNRAFAKR